jgi:hypothetical protein
VVAFLGQFTLAKSQIVVGGGGRSKVSQSVDGFFYGRGWAKKSFDIEVKVDQGITLTPTHEVDLFRNRVAIETEWNNKTEFYDRDLTTFRLLFDLDVVSVGIIITRGSKLQELFNKLDIGKKYGPTTTHWNKLVPKIKNRVHGGCPVLAFGMKRAVYDPKA